MHLIQTEARGGHRGRRGGGIWGIAGRPSERPELIKVISLENGEPTNPKKRSKQGRTQVQDHHADTDGCWTRALLQTAGPSREATSHETTMEQK